MRKFLGVFVFMALSEIFGSTAQAYPIYVGISGRVQDLSQDQVISSLQAAFIAPLESLKGHVKTYFLYEIDGNRNLVFGLITESADDAGTQALSRWSQDLEQTGFHGLEVKFHTVARISERVELLAGVHKTNAGENEVETNSETDRQYDLSSVAAWESFTDRVGEALQSRNSKALYAFLRWFIGNPDAYSDYLIKTLSQDDTLIAELNPVLVLEDGSAPGPSPFIELPFGRNCWAKEYEDGMCYRPTR